MTVSRQELIKLLNNNSNFFLFVLQQPAEFNAWLNKEVAGNQPNINFQIAVNNFSEQFKSIVSRQDNNYFNEFLSTLVECSSRETSTHLEKFGEVASFLEAHITELVPTMKAWEKDWKEQIKRNASTTRNSYLLDLVNLKRLVTVFGLDEMLSNISESCKKTVSPQTWSDPNYQSRINNYIKKIREFFSQPGILTLSEGEFWGKAKEFVPSIDTILKPQGNECDTIEFLHSYIEEETLEKVAKELIVSRFDAADKAGQKQQDIRINQLLYPINEAINKLRSDMDRVKELLVNLRNELAEHLAKLLDAKKDIAKETISDDLQEIIKHVRLVSSKSTINPEEHIRSFVALETFLDKLEAPKKANSIAPQSIKDPRVNIILYPLNKTIHHLPENQNSLKETLIQLRDELATDAQTQLAEGVPEQDIRSTKVGVIATHISRTVSVANREDALFTADHKLAIIKESEQKIQATQGWTRYVEPVTSVINMCLQKVANLFTNRHSLFKPSVHEQAKAIQKQFEFNRDKLKQSNSEGSLQSTDNTVQDSFANRLGVGSDSGQ